MGVVLICVLLSTFTNGPDLQGEHAQKPFAQKLQLLGWLGTFLFIFALTPFILALQFAAQYGWNSTSSIAMWVLAGVSLIAFVIQQRNSSNKIFDPVIALNRSVWPTCGLFFSALSAVAVLVLFLPFLLQVSLSLKVLFGYSLTFYGSWSKAFLHKEVVLSHSPWQSL
jgi:hypothetical protein